ncbi:MAG: DEAD/DEAH box helicase family protein [Planctomycetota bacterium]
MPLKRYQERVIREVKSFLDILAVKQAAGNRHAALDTWEELKIPGHYNERKNGLGKDLPTFCIKVPTGGGKTLLATQMLGLVYRSVLKERNGTGLVLWVVPSDQIYKDTLRRLRDRRDYYRESLEFAVSRRIEVWEKDEIARLTPAQLAANLNILVLKLASTNRETRDQLKFFRDSGGNIVQHFPPEDDVEGHKALKMRIHNLEMIEENSKSGRYLARTSIGNLVRLSEPAVILDEAHKYRSDLSRRTVEAYNASILVELSATPIEGENTLVHVSGKELLDEEMIKLPINVANSNQKSWMDCLVAARDKREALAALAVTHYKESGKFIRPIVLVQVERVGHDQRDGRLVHSEDVKEHLMRKMGVSEKAIAIKTSETDDIEGIDLLNEGCAIEWIITKAALQEGWDCPFAYLLVSLSNMGSKLAMTQLVGRILRQPHTRRTPHEELNQSYVFCLRRRAVDVVHDVKAALEKEGYEGDATSVVDRSGEGGAASAKRKVAMRRDVAEFYRPFEGKVYLPRFCVRSGREYEPLDYYRHLASQVDIRGFRYDAADWNLSTELAATKETFFRVGLGGTGVDSQEEREAAVLENDEQVKAWLVAGLPFEWLGFKATREVVEKAARRFLAANRGLAGRLGLVKFPARDRIIALVERETDRQTQETFEKLFNERRLEFYLECVEARFELPPEMEIPSTERQLVRDDNTYVQRYLFECVSENQFNDYEKSVALFLDSNPEVLWWYRNLVGPEHFSIQGYRSGKIYPDFIVQKGRDRRPAASVVVVESKGRHLKGNEDTEYKRKVAEYFGRVGQRVPWQKLSRGFPDNRFCVRVIDEGLHEDWKTELRKILETEE